MFCNKCGVELKSGAKFCIKCGATIDMDVATQNKGPLTTVEKEELLTTVEQSEALPAEEIKKEPQENKKKKSAKNKNGKKGKKAVLIGVLIVLLLLISCGGYFYWASEAPIAIPYIKLISEPQSFEYSIDGEVVLISWDEVNQADQYEVELNDERTIIRKNNATIIDAMPGETVRYSVRAMKSFGKFVFASDWVDQKIDLPSIDYNDIDYKEATFLSINQLCDWAKQHGYKYKIIDEQDGKIVEISCKDSQNSGAFNTATRVLGAAWNGFSKGYSDSVEDDFSSLQDIIVGYVQGGNVKGFFNNSKDTAELSGKVGAALSTIKSLTADTDIKYTYYFDDEYHSSNMAIGYFLKNNRESFKKSYDNHYMLDSEGRYVISSEQFNCNVYAEVTEVTSDGFEKWAVVFTK